MMICECFDLLCTPPWLTKERYLNSGFIIVLYNHVIRFGLDIMNSKVLVFDTVMLIHDSVKLDIFDMCHTCHTLMS